MEEAGFIEFTSNGIKYTELNNNNHWVVTKNDKFLIILKTRVTSENLIASVGFTDKEDEAELFSDEKLAMFLANTINGTHKNSTRSDNYNV